MSSRISIFNPSGIKLTELDVNLTRSWILNKHSHAFFEISTQDAKATQEFLRFGNLIMAEHDKLPVWGGRIDTPRNWRIGTIRVSCYSAEHILLTRYHDNVYVRGTPGDIFEQFIYTANRPESSLFSIGEIYRGKAGYASYQPYMPLYGVIKQWDKYFGEDWSVIPKITSSGNLSFECSWYKKRGETRLERLIEDTNIKLQQLLTEQGEIINSVLVYGDGATWPTRPVAVAKDLESPYGYREKAYHIRDMDAAGAQAIADQKLADVKKPRKTFRLTVLDDTITAANSIFHNIRLGDVMPLDLYTTGFTEGDFGLVTSVRILGMKYSDLNNQLEIVCDED